VIAYDLLMSNQTASAIKSNAPLTIEAGESFESNDLTLKTYNNGDVVIDSPGGVTLNQAQAWTLASSTTALNFQSGLLNLDTTNSRVGIGTTSPTARLDIAPSGSTFGIIVGADVSAGTRTDATRKFARIGLPHYTNAEEPLTILTADSDGTNNYINIGGGTSIGNAPTVVTFATAANTTTLTGTERMRIDSAGNVGINDTSPDAKLEVLSTTEQLRLTYTDGTVDSRFTVDASGNLTIDNTGTKTIITDDLQVSGLDILDSNGNESIRLTATASAVNEITLANAATAGTPTITASGGDTNVALSVNSKGTGALNLNNTATGDILIGGGSGSTGCTITNASGNLTCTGSITSNGYLNLDVDNLLYNGDFESNSTAGWSFTGTTTVTTGGYAGNYTSQSTGASDAVSTDYIPVNPVTDVLQLEGYFKKTVAGVTPGLVYFGYKAYTAAKTEITTAPCGTYCYSAASAYVLPADGNWHKFSSTMTGEGTSYPNFPVGTKYIRVLALINYSASGDAVTQMDHITLKRINHGPLAVGNYFSSQNLVDQQQTSLLYTTNTNNFIIAPPSSGGVGIGDTTPDARLDVEPTGAVTTTVGGTAVAVSNLTTNVTTDAINKSGIYVTSTGAFTGSTGTATNNWGLYVDTVSGADNNYGAYIAGSVGIGTSAPTATLQVDGNHALNVLGVTNWGASMAVAHANYPGIAFGSVAAGMGALIREDSGALRFINGTRGTGSWGGQENLTILATGYVGIGAPTPVDLLNLSSTGLGRLAISDTDVNAAGENWYLQAASGNFYIGQSTEAAGAYSGLSDKLTILNGGNVGIGTASPGSTLEVNGNTRLSAVAAGSRYILLGTDAAAATGTGNLVMQAGSGSAGYGGALNLFAHSHATKPGWVTIGISQSAGSGATEGRFTVNDQGLAGGTDVFTVLRTGSVGIGTPTPGAKLEVAGGTYLGGDVTFTTFNGTRSITALTQAAGSGITGVGITAQAGEGAERTDDLGVGVSGGIVTLSGGTGGYKNVSGSFKAGTGGNVVIKGGQGGGAGDGESPGDGGNVVIKGGPSIGGGMQTSSPGNIYIYSPDTYGTGALGNILLGVADSGAGGGNVGIGTPAPGNTLTVKGISRLESDGATNPVDYRWQITGPTANYDTLYLGAETVSGNETFPGPNGDGNSIISFKGLTEKEVGIGYDAGASAHTAKLSVNGNVGIGDASPDATLDVEAAAPAIIIQDNDAAAIGAMSAYVSLRNNAGTEMAWIGDGGSGSTLSMYGGAGYSVGLGTNGTADRLFIDTAGNVGIGTTPTARLDVAYSPVATGASATGILNTFSPTATSNPNTLKGLSSIATLTGGTGGVTSGGFYGGYFEANLNTTGTGGSPTASNTYGIYAKSTSTNVARNTGSTNTYYGGYFEALGSADSTNTSVNYGLYVNAAGADTNYAAAFMGAAVGIGTATPSALLDVSAANPQFTLTDTTAGEDDFTLSANSDSLEFLSGTQRNILTLGGETSSYAGRVGIGTASPDALFDIEKAAPDAAYTETVRITNPSSTASGRNTVNWYNSAGAMASARLYSEAGSGYNASKFFIDVADSSQVLQNRFLIDVAGNVGIGVAVPAQKLEVAGKGMFNSPSGSGGDLNTSGNGVYVYNSGSRYLLLSNTGTGSDIQSNGADLFVNYATNTNVYFGGSGTIKVGIGTIGPSGVLHVVGPQPATISGTGPGTAATDALIVTGGTGGNTSFAGNANGTGGIGSDMSLTGGNGGITDGYTTATGGKGGSLVFTGGNGGSITAGQGGNTRIGGAGGDIALMPGSGGTASGGAVNTAGAAGKVGIGDSTPDYGLDVVADINSDDCFREAGTQVAGTCASDERLKLNIVSLTGSLDKITALNPVSFEWKPEVADMGGTFRYVAGRQVGLIAQEIQKVFPHLVEEKNGYFAVKYNLELQMEAINAIKELNSLAVKFDSTGNVGIGTATPAAKLDVIGDIKVTAAGTPLSLDLTGATDVNAVRSIFDAKANGVTKFNILETGDATLSGKIAVGSLQTISDAEFGGSVGIGGDLATGGLVRLDKDGKMMNIAAVTVTSSVNSDGTVSLGAIPATSVGSSVSIAQTSADPVAATRAALALSTAGSSPLDYLVWSNSFQVTHDGRVVSKSLEVKENIVFNSADLAAGTLIEGTVGDSFTGYLIKFTSTSGKTLFAVNSSGILEFDSVKTRALVLDNADASRATIGSGTIPPGMMSVVVTAPEVKPGMKVFLSPKVALTQALAVTQVDVGSFTVALAQGVTSEVAFDWWAVDVTNATIITSPLVTTTPTDTTTTTTTTTPIDTTTTPTTDTSTTTTPTDTTITTPTDTTTIPVTTDTTTTP
jgi:hypothetical protein